MMEIKLTVEVLGIPEAINNLAAAIRGQTASSPAVASTPTGSADSLTQTPVSPSEAGNADAAPNVQPSNSDVPTSPQPPVTPTTAFVSMPTPSPTSDKKITAEDISRAGAALVDQGKMADVINLLRSYGVQAITQLKEDVYPAFANDLRALGAVL